MSLCGSSSEESNNLLIFPGARPLVAQAALVPPGTIESDMRAVLASHTGCKHPDRFDWSVSDRIANPSSEPPRGSGVLNTTFELVNHHSTCTKCHYAFEIDSYGRGCFHNCAYCYAKDQLEGHGYQNRPQPFPVNLAEVRKVFYAVFETQTPSKWREIIERRVPIRGGSRSDSFMWLHVFFIKIKNFFINIKQKSFNVSMLKVQSRLLQMIICL